MWYIMETEMRGILKRRPRWQLWQLWQAVATGRRLLPHSRVAFELWAYLQWGGKEGGIG